MTTGGGSFPFKDNAAELMARWRDGYVGDVFVSEELREASARWHRTQISPSTMLKLQQVWDEIDVRPALPSITAPKLVINDQEALLAEVEEFLTGSAPRPAMRRGSLLRPRTVRPLWR